MVDSEQPSAIKFNEPPLVALNRRIMIKHSEATRFFDARWRIYGMLAATK